MTGARVDTRTLGWLTATALALLAVALPRLALTYDLGFFLPPPASDAQQVLIERLGQGPGTQLIFAVLPDASEVAANELATALRAHRSIRKVLPEASSPGIDSIPRAVWDNRLLLADLPTSTSEWQQVLEERLMDTMVADEDLLDLIAADPLLTSVSALERASSATSQPVFQSGTNRFLLIQTANGAFDLDSQHEAVTVIRETLGRLGHQGASLYGSGVYGVDLQASVRRESTLFSVLASIALAAVVFMRFRNLLTVIAVGIPLLVGGSLGLAAIAFLFDQVHGITLAFGFTLLGVAIDYPLHLLSHVQPSATGPRSIWPTLGLGIVSTLVAYLAFVFSGTAGMQQLGVFATTGLAGAAVAAFLLSRKNLNATGVPGPTDRALANPATPSPPLTDPRPNQWWWVITLATVGLALQGQTQQGQTLFSDNLSDMTPVPKKTLEADTRLRATMGVADLRYLISVRQNSLEATLRTLEEVSTELDRQVNNGALSKHQSVTSLLPSRHTQESRIAAARNLLQNGNFERAVADSGFDPEAFTPFLEMLRDTARQSQSASNSRGWLDPDSLLDQSPELEPVVSAMLYQNEQTSLNSTAASQWIALIFLSGLSGDSADSAPGAPLREALGVIPGAAFIDLKQASMALVSDYRQRVFRVLGAALVAIALLLLVATRDPGRVLWLLGTTAAAIATSLVAGTCLLGGLSLFDVIALALVAGLGLDYALFFSRPGITEDDARITSRAITLCALSSLLVFGILGFSSIPLLRGLGLTVASGVAAAYLLARLGRRRSAASRNRAH